METRQQFNGRVRSKITKELKISQTTFNRAFKSTGYMSDKLRETILRIADEVGYTPIERSRRLSLSVKLTDIGDFLGKSRYLPNNINGRVSMTLVRMYREALVELRYIPKPVDVTKLYTSYKIIDIFDSADHDDKLCRSTPILHIGLYDQYKFKNSARMNFADMCNELVFNLSTDVKRSYRSSITQDECVTHYTRMVDVILGIYALATITSQSASYRALLESPKNHKDVVGTDDIGNIFQIVMCPITNRIQTSMLSIELGNRFPFTSEFIMRTIRVVSSIRSYQFAQARKDVRKRLASI